MGKAGMGARAGGPGARLAALAVVALAVAGCLGTEVGPPAGAGPLRYRDPVFSSYSASRDLQYGSAPGLDGRPEALKLDLFQPTGDTVAKRPAVIWVHGGGFSSGDKRSEEHFVAPLVKRGYVGATLDYRLLAPTGCSGATVGSTCTVAAYAGINDGQAAVRWLRANAGKYRIDPNRIAIEGFSAGGVVATGVGLLSDAPGSSGNPGYSSKVRAWLSVAGGVPNGQSVDRTDPPGFLFHGTADPTVPYQWSFDTAHKLSDTGQFAVLYTRPGAGHTVPAESLLAEQAANFYYLTMDLKNAQR